MHTAVIWEHSMKLPKNLASTVSVTHCKQLAKSRLGNLYLIYLNFFTRTWQRSAWTRTTWCRKKAAGQGRAEKIWLCGVGNQAWFNFRNILALFLVACLLVCQPQLSSVLAQSYALTRVPVRSLLSAHCKSRACFSGSKTCTCTCYIMTPFYCIVKDESDAVAPRIRDKCWP